MKKEKVLSPYIKQYERPNNTERLRWFLLHLAFVLVIAFIISYMVLVPNYNSSFDDGNCVSITDGWEYVDTNDEISFVSFPNKLENNITDGIRISYTLPQEESGIVLEEVSLWAGMREVNAYLEGEQIFHYGVEELEKQRNNPFFRGKTAGPAFIFIPIPHDAYGQKLTLEITSPYKEYQGIVKTIFLGTRIGIVYELVRMYGVDVLLAFLLLIMGVGLLVAYIILHKHLGKEKGFIYLGWFQICCGLWVFSESGLAQLFFNNVLLFDSFSYLCLIIFPIPLIMFINNAREFHANKWIKAIIVIKVIECLLTVLLQFFSYMEFYEVLPYNHIVFLVTTSIVTFFTIREIFVYKNKNFYSCFCCSLVLCICGILEITQFYLSNRFQVGLYFKIGAAICTFIIAFHVFSRATCVLKSSREAMYYESLAYIDFMTQCYNRTSYLQEMEKQEQIVEEKDTIIMLMADLNNLKSMNDMLGHHIGDIAIKKCGQLLLQNFKEIGNCYRVGGDEFICIFYNCNEEAVKKSLLAFQMACELENCKWEYEFAVATGYAVFDSSVDANLENTLKRADGKMYDHKKVMKSGIYF